MGIVSFQGVCKTFGHQAVFGGLCQEFFAGEKVGMVGANGSGKTTLLRLILGEIVPDSGKVNIQKGLRVGYLPQEAVFDGQRTVMEEMHAGLEDLLGIQNRLHGLAEQMEELHGDKLESVMSEYDRLGHEFEMAGGYAVESRIKSILAGLEIGKELYHAKTSALSGGQLSRLGLAKVLLKETDLLLLDEPTNHLDLQATDWLEKFIRNFDGAVIVISHDRYLLDRIAGKIIELERGKSTTWKGNYSNYVATKEITVLQQQREYEKRREMVAKTRDFIARNKDKEGMRKTARGRKTRLDKMLAEEPDFLARPEHDRTINFGFAKAKGRSDLVLRCEGLCKAFDSLVLFDGFDLDLLSGERLGITGPNGTGKSTFLKMALGQMEASSGLIRMGETLSVGYLDQHGMVLDGENTVLEETHSARPDLATEAVRGILGAFLFSGDDVFKRIEDLSGGQQNRLMLCKLVITEPDVLLLDEPTNHLDIASREMLEEALRAYNGAVIVVSHDRYFLNQVADRLLVVGADEYGSRSLGKCDLIVDESPYTAYAEKVAKCLEEKQLEKPKPGGSKPKRAKSGSGGRKTVPTELKRFNKLTVEQIEEMILSLEEKIEELQEEFGDEKYYQNPELLDRLQGELDKDKQELGLLYKAYEIRISP